MAEPPVSAPSRQEVRRAGRKLHKGNLIWTPEAAPEILEVFRVANAWRDLHAYPMERVRAQILGRLNRLSLHGKLTAARLKRMPSIRKKLRTRHLDVIQDLAGIRVILPRMSDVEAVAASCRADLPHGIYDTSDYIAEPRPSGYRSLHLLMEYTPTNGFDEVCRDCRIELQIRTSFQHAWATAVEAVGLFRNESLKNGSGSPDWLRLFQLMASEIALIENCPEVGGSPGRRERIEELRDLNRRLDAAAYLESISTAADFTDRYIRLDPSEFYLIRFDLKTHAVTVDGYNAATGSRVYHATEQDDERYDTVLVATDKVTSLKKAFPNYFGDTRRFATALRRIVKGKDVPEFLLPPQQTMAPGPRQPRDLDWLRRSTRQRHR